MFQRVREGLFRVFVNTKVWKGWGWIRKVLTLDQLKIPGDSMHSVLDLQSTLWELLQSTL